MKKVILSWLLSSIAISLATAQADQDQAKIYELPSVGVDYSRLMVRFDYRKLAQSKISPKHKWQFDFIAATYCRPVGPPESFRLRFRIYSQFRRIENDPAMAIATWLGRLWEYNAQRLKVDHSDFYGAFVDVYLCFGGKAGGEQLFDEDDRGAVRTNVNTIYIYDITSLTDTLEMARELAHEYGHATLPAVGGFASPESWGNGYLGEYLAMTWLRQDLAAKRLAPGDACGATLDQLNNYYKLNIEPKLAKVRKSGPDWIALTESKNMDAFLGVGVFAESVLPSTTLSRAMHLNSKATGLGFAESLVEAAAELPKWTVSPGPEPIFLPIGRGKVAGGKVLSQKKGWAKIQPTAASLTITNPALPN